MITELFEVAIAVKDLDAAVKKYSNILCITPVFLKSEQLPFPGSKVAVFPIGNVILNLCAPEQPDDSFAKFIKTRGEGVFLIGLEVTDVEQDMKELAEKGVEFSSDKPLPYYFGRVGLGDPKSLHGVRIGFAQHKPGWLSLLTGE